ncbi:MAG: HAD family phosphatase [Clostridia bacterium]|nr:HAD family phosphatase [Clostridia bacterium]
MYYKLICSDLDDTLLTSDGRVLPEVKDAVHKYVQNGGKFAIVTGRMTAGAIPVARMMDIHGEIATYQGAHITDIDSGRLLFSETIPTADAVRVGRYLEERGIYYQTYIGDYFYTAVATDYTRLYGRLSFADFVETKYPLSRYLEENAVCPPKLLIMQSPDRIPGTLVDLREKFGKEFLINTSKPFIIEIVPLSVNKAFAVRRLAERYGLSVQEVVCVGDSENDLPMIEFAGVGAVVNNASDEVKSHADFVAKSNDEGGLAQVVDFFGSLDAPYVR